MARSPHYLRFAQALALAGSAATGTAGCYDNHRDVEGTDAAVADAGTSDAPFACSECSCGWIDTGASPPSCDSLGHWECCAAVGPCAPPDLPA